MCCWRDKCSNPKARVRMRFEEGEKGNGCTSSGAFQLQQSKREKDERDREIIAIFGFSVGMEWCWVGGLLQRKSALLRLM